MSCRNGHDVDRQLLGGKMRCPDCHRDGNRRRAANKRARAKGLLPPAASSLRCPYCSLFPCRCEAL